MRAPFPVVLAKKCTCENFSCNYLLRASELPSVIGIQAADGKLKTPKEEIEL